MEAYTKRAIFYDQAKYDKRWVWEVLGEGEEMSQRKHWRTTRILSKIQTYLPDHTPEFWGWFWEIQWASNPGISWGTPNHGMLPEVTGGIPTQCLSPCRKREHTHGGRPTDLSLRSLWSWRYSDDSFCINLFLTRNSQLIFCFFGEFSWRWKGNCFNRGPGMSKNWKLSCQFDWCIISSWQSPSEHFQHSGVRPRQQRARLFSHAWYVCVDQMQHHLSRPVDAVQHSHFQVFGSSWASLLATICDLWIVSPQKWEDLVE